MLAVGCSEPLDAPAIDLGQLLASSDVEGFARAEGKRQFRFPADHGPHQDYRSEWWYLTGQLQDRDGEEFGFQLTFFRHALAPGEPAVKSPWASNQYWMAHAALSDIAGKRHLQDQRLSRGALGLAGAMAKPWQVWVEDWNLGAGGEDGNWQLDAGTRDFSLALNLLPRKAPVLHGDAGLSRKSLKPGNASWYYSMTRIDVTGNLDYQGRARSVKGQAWLDREWSTSALDADQSGWDWLAIQFDAGGELMYYRLRDAAGGTHAASAGTRVDSQGEITRLDDTSIVMEPIRFWQDEEDMRWPVAWRLTVPASGEQWLIEPAFDAQLMRTLVRYWEGSIVLRDSKSGNRLGLGYLELTGYGDRPTLPGR